MIETIFSRLENLELRLVRAITRKGLAIKITLSILVFDILQSMRRFDGN